MKTFSVFFAEQAGFEEADADTKAIRGADERELGKGLDQFGIISLSEDPYNLLMWSHYAAEHTGVVMSIKCDCSTFAHHYPFTERGGVSAVEPVRVRYSNVRPGYQMPGCTRYEYVEHHLSTHFAMIKGIDWSYEKEHRYLLRLTEADVVIAQVNVAGWETGQGSDVCITHLYDKTFKIQTSGAEKRDVLFRILALAQGRGDISNVMYFKRLKRNAITGIYFGSRVKGEDMLAVREKIESNSLLAGSISFYKSIESPDKFEVAFKKLDARLPSRS